MKTFLLLTLMFGLCSFSIKLSGDESFYQQSNFVLSGDFLYLQAKQSGLNYTTDPLSVFTTTDFSDGSLVFPSFSWDPGYRLYAGYTDPCWSAGLQYTQCCNSACSSKESGLNDGIFPTLSFSSNIFPNDYITSAWSHWCMQTSLLDAIAGYNFCISNSFSVTPTIGLRNVWISEKIHARYSGATFIGGFDDVSLNSKFYGVGPRVGINPIWKLDYGLSLYGEVAASILYGWMNTHQKEIFIDTIQGSFHRHIKGVYWNADAIAGINWKYCTNFCSFIKEYMLDVGFDFLYFNKQYAFKHGPEFTLSSQDKYLMLYGIHVSAGVQF